MAYDEELADRIRALMATEDGVTEKRMFGGLAFLVGGHMSAAASGRGGLMVRVDPAESDELIDSTSAEPMIMGGRPMDGWLRVPGEDLDSEGALERWVRIGVARARSLQPKR